MTSRMQSQLGDGDSSQRFWACPFVDRAGLDRLILSGGTPFSYTIVSTRHFFLGGQFLADNLFTLVDS